MVSGMVWHLRGGPLDSGYAVDGIIRAHRVAARLTHLHAPPRRHVRVQFKGTPRATRSIFRPYVCIIPGRTRLFSEGHVCNASVDGRGLAV